MLEELEVVAMLVAQEVEEENKLLFVLIILPFVELFLFPKLS